MNYNDDIVAQNGNFRKKPLKYVALLPSLITLVNGLCGFGAICFASKALMASVGTSSAGGSGIGLAMKYFAISGYLIFVAMIADMLDGRVARMSNSTSSFGGQLDSLCDMISFGIAPAFLVLNLLKYHLAISSVNPGLMTFIIRFLWLTTGVYVSCTAIRLARFNVENDEDETSHMSFLGLPSPAAAGTVASIVLFYNMLPDISDKGSVIFDSVEVLIMISLPIFTLASAALMISRIRYPHLINQYLRGRKPFAHLIWVLALIGMLIWNHQLTLLLSFVGFSMSGPVRKYYLKFIRKTKQSNCDVQNGLPAEAK